MFAIRKATLQDAQIAWDIRHEAVLNQCRTDYPLDDLVTWTGGPLPDRYAQLVTDHFYVAASADGVIGTGMVNLENGQIDAIFVHPAHMRKGIGVAMMQHLEVQARQAGLATLKLDATLNAAPFYRACGFTSSQMAQYQSPRGITLACIPMVKSLH